MKVHDYSTHENIGTFKIVEPFKDIFCMIFQGFWAYQGYFT